MTQTAQPVRSQEPDPLYRSLLAFVGEPPSEPVPGWDPVNVNVLFYAQEILAPVSLEVLTLTSLREFTKSLAGIHYNKD